MRPSHAQRTNDFVPPYVPRSNRSDPTPHYGGPPRTSNHSDDLYFLLVLIFLLEFYAHVVFHTLAIPPRGGRLFLLVPMEGSGLNCFPPDTKRLSWGGFSLFVAAAAALGFQYAIALVSCMRGLSRTIQHQMISEKKKKKKKIRMAVTRSQSEQNRSSYSHPK